MNYRLDKHQEIRDNLYSMDKRSFTDSEILFIKSNYLSMSHKNIANTLGRTECAIQLKCSKLRLLKEKVDLTGLKFNKLTVLSEVEKEKRKHRYVREHLCFCECGNENIRVRRSAILGGHTKSCGCIQKERTSQLSKNKRLPIGEPSIRHLENAYKQSAKRRKIEYLLSHEDFANIIALPCNYCDGMPEKFNMFYTNELILHAWVKKNNYDIEWASKQWIVKNGIDRINSAIGYIFSNCVPCCETCNYAKSNKTLEEFNKWLKRIANKYNEK